ncbi:hypothetical protein EYR36_010004 [Pleurotus pulmonarius]|nr:hypothetical protein EYR36_010004 [Pleurotus pulmonarius]KAF4593479.1 hypothetical protein EYR38_009194 [Pleurotus pulmonarius]
MDSQKISSPFEYDRYTSEFDRTPLYRCRFKRHIREGDWDRFERYSSRVQSLRFDTEFEDAVFSKISLGRRRLDFLPNLAAIYNPPSSITSFQLFAHVSVKTLEFHADFEGDHIEIISSRMHHLDRLIVLSERRDGYSIPTTLQQLHSLLHVAISAPFLDFDTFRVLASLPNLRSIKTSKVGLRRLPLYWAQMPFTVPERCYRLPESVKFPLAPFPSLEDLDIDIHFSEAIKLLSLMKHPALLQVLRIKSPSTESAAGYTRLINHVGAVCTGLKSLELARAPVAAGSSKCIPQSDDPCGLESLTNLKSLTLRVFDMWSPQLVRILESLPELETLVLTGGRRSPLHHLSLIARHAKKLKKLEIELYLEPMSTLLLDSFSNLQNLNVAYTPISNPESGFIADFLTRILPLGCEVTFRRSDSAHIWGLVRKMVVLARLKGVRA